MFTFFYIVETCEAVQKHWSGHYLYRTVGGGGGEGLMLVEVEVFSGVGGGGGNFFQGN